jgi:hypothetical protein
MNTECDIEPYPEPPPAHAKEYLITDLKGIWSQNEKPLVEKMVDRPVHAGARETAHEDDQIVNAPYSVPIRSCSVNVESNDARREILAMLGKENITSMTLPACEGVDDEARYKAGQEILAMIGNITSASLRASDGIRAETNYNAEVLGTDEQTRCQLESRESILSGFDERYEENFFQDGSLSGWSFEENALANEQLAVCECTPIVHGGVGQSNITQATETPAPFKLPKTSWRIGEAAAKELQSKRSAVTIASVNAVEAPAALQRYNVSKFPMLVWFRKGQWVREVPPSSRSTAKILEFVDWSSQPPVIDFEKRSDLDDAVPQIRGVLKPGAPPVIVGFASSPDVRSALEMVGESFRGDTAFLVTNETRAGDPVLRALSSENGTDQEYRDVVESEKIQTWVKDVLAKTKLLRKR